MESLERRLQSLEDRWTPAAPPLAYVIWHPDTGTYTDPQGRPIAPDAIPPGTKCYSGIDPEAV